MQKSNIHIGQLILVFLLSDFLNSFLSKEFKIVHTDKYYWTKICLLYVPVDSHISTFFFRP